MKFVNTSSCLLLVTVLILISSICTICAADGNDDGEKAPCNLITRTRSDRQLFPYLSKRIGSKTHNRLRTRTKTAASSISLSKQDESSGFGSLVKAMPKTLSLLMNKRLWFAVAVVELIYAFISAIDGIFGIIEKTGVLYDYITDPIEDSPDTITSLMRVVDTIRKIFKLMTSDDDTMMR